MSEKYKTKYHKNGSVTIWDCYSQSWRVRIKNVSHDILATLLSTDRDKVIEHTKNK